MRIHLSPFLFLFLFGSHLGSAQSAPDFTLTDSWGSTHRLYENIIPLRLISNIVSSELVFEILNKTSDIEISILNTAGQKVFSHEMKSIQGLSFSVNAGLLAAGIWVCRVVKKDKFVASYLFIKQ